MKAKTVSKEISKKMNDWIASITDVQLKDELRAGVIVTGGCITSMFLQEDVNDYDVYLSSDALAYKVALYYGIQSGFPGLQITVGGDFPVDIITASKDIGEPGRVELYISSAGVAKLKPDSKKKYQALFLSSNAITLTDKVQVILRFTGDAEAIHSNYDFQHATNYWTFETGLVTNVGALECIIAKELIYRGSKYPLSSIFRTRKFIQRGWSCHVGNYLKMAMQLNELELTDLAVLKEQLTGVDAAYLSSIIATLENASCDITSSYVCEVIDKVMGDGDD